MPIPWALTLFNDPQRGKTKRLYENEEDTVPSSEEFTDKWRRQPGTETSPECLKSATKGANCRGSTEWGSHQLYLRKFWKEKISVGFWEMNLLPCGEEKGSYSKSTDFILSRRFLHSSQALSDNRILQHYLLLQIHSFPLSGQATLLCSFHQFSSFILISAGSFVMGRLPHSTNLSLMESQYQTQSMDIYGKPKVSIILNGEILNAFLLRS